MHRRSSWAWLFVLAGSMSYGVVAPVIKIAYAQGFVWQETASAQALYGFLLFLVALVFQRLRGKKLAPVSKRGLAQLFLTGLCTAGTCILYNASLMFLPVAAALTLLFQFAWMGTVAQVIMTRRAPTVLELLSVVIVVAGSVLASNMLGIENSFEWNVPGVVCGLGSAVTYTSFMIMSGRAEPDMPGIQRGLLIAVVPLVLTLFYCPSLIPSGTAITIAPFGLIQGFFAMLLPVVAFGFGMPFVPAGVASILASAELPTSIALSVVMIGEAVSASQIVGVVLIIVGIGLSHAQSLART